MSHENAFLLQKLDDMCGDFDILSVAQLADLLEVSPGSLHQRIRRGALPFVVVGSRFGRIIAKKEVAAFIRRGKTIGFRTRRIIDPVKRLRAKGSTYFDFGAG